MGLSFFVNEVELMRKYIGTILVTVFIFILTGCGNAGDVESNVAVLEDETMPELTETLQRLIDHETELSEIFNASLTDESLENFKNQDSVLYENLNERTEIVRSLQSFEEDLTSAAENIKNADISESERFNEENIETLVGEITKLSETIGSIRTTYENVISSETAYLESLGGDDADYTMMSEGIAEVNDIHSQVLEHYETVNSQLQTLSGYGHAVGKSSDDKALVLEEPSTGEAGAADELLYTIDPATSNIVPTSDTAESSVVLLTIDDAPDQHALEMADTLKALDAPAIFFVNGMYIESEEGQEKLREIHDMGFEIGNHTYNHFNLQELTPEDTYLEIIDTSDLIEEVIGERPRFFRAPFGVNSASSLEIAAEDNMSAMNWTYGYDWDPAYQESDALANIMVNTEILGDGANLLMHDRAWTAGALSEIVTGLREQGYTFVDPKNINTEGGVTE